MTYTFFPSAPAAAIRPALPPYTVVIDLPNGEGALTMGLPMGSAVPHLRAVECPPCFTPSPEVAQLLGEEALIELRHMNPGA